MCVLFLLCLGYHEYDVRFGQFLILVVSIILLSVIGTNIRRKSSDSHRCQGIYSVGPCILVLLWGRLVSSALLLTIRDFAYLVKCHIWNKLWYISKTSFSIVRRRHGRTILSSINNGPIVHLMYRPHHITLLGYCHWCFHIAQCVWIVFRNFDSPRWDKFIRQYPLPRNVNGISFGIRRTTTTLCTRFFFNFSFSVKCLGVFWICLSGNKVCRCFVYWSPPIC